MFVGDLPIALFVKIDRIIMSFLQLFQEGNENSNSSNSVSPGSNTTTSITPQATLSLSDSISRSRMNLMTVHRAPAVTKHTDPITGATSSITHRTGTS